ncbi:TetR/AcrR family transcriptional regulator [Phaeobacter sp. BS52]|uniref:TetR/AcrR family transcriptional regulator n=1 Tax=Phaeobacter sp. BS52 TaxID=2907241 RepID=UPI003865A6DA
MTSENSTIQTNNLIFKAGTSLSTELILDTALTLAEEVGSLEKLSLRKIGKALNADPTAIYRYFRSKNELLQAMADRIYSRMLLDERYNRRGLGYSAYRNRILHPQRLSGLSDDWTGSHQSV